MNEIRHISITHPGHGYTSEPASPTSGCVVSIRVIKPPYREPGNERCPMLGTKWLGYGDHAVNRLAPFSWKGGYVLCHTNLGDRLWLYEEFWDWQRDSSAVCRPLDDVEPPARWGGAAI